MSGSRVARLGRLAIASMVAAGCGSLADGSSRPAEDGGTVPEPLPFFVGRWAATEAACSHAAWEFAPDGLSTPGEVTCAFDQVTRTPGGYEIAAICTAEGPPEPERIRLSYAQSARAMLVEGGPFNPVGLVACDGRRP